MRAHELPPEGFDPHTAPQELLQRHGLPRRPDPDKEPHLAWLWKRALARPPTFVKAELAADPLMSAPGLRRPKDPDFIGQQSWAGVIRTMTAGTDFAEPATCVVTEVQVPEVYNLTPDQPVGVAFWAGIDAGGPSLQAGLTALVDPPGFLGFGGGLSFHVWARTDAANHVANFQISSGQTLLIMVNVDQSGGSAYFHNLSTSLATSVLVPGITVTGGTVEWIVEAVTDYLPFFSTVTFDNCTAGTSTGLFYITPDEEILNITGNPAPGQDTGPNLTETFIASRTILVVGEKAVNWP